MHACGKFTGYSALMDYGTALKERHGNPSRRSAHHRKQERFEGSNRQARGLVLKLLSRYGRARASTLAERLGIGRERARRSVRELCEEGLVTRKGRYLELAR